MNYFGRLSDRFGKLPVFRILALFTIVPILLITNLPPVPLAVALGATTLFYITTSGRMVPATAMITACTAPRNRGSFMSVNSSVQQMALGLAALVGGAIVGKTPEGALTHYEVVGALAAIATLISVILAGRLRVAAGGLESVVRLDVPAVE
jgi:predicted MFS family arabinose efflux permease